MEPANQRILKVAGRAVCPGFEVLGTALFSAYRLREAIAFAPSVWQDSEAYRNVSQHPWLSGALWAGRRAPGVPVLLKLTGSYQSYGILEAVAGVVAWGFLAWTVSTFVRKGWRRPAAFCLVLGFATAPLVTGWDWSVLSESVSLSALAVSCAAILWLLKRFTWVRLLGVGAALLVYNGLRDSDIWEVGAVGVVLIAIGLMMTIQGAALVPGGIRAGLRKNLARTSGALVLGLTVAGTAALTGAGASISHRNVLNIEQVFYVRIFPYADRVSWFSAHGMPDGPAIDAMASQVTAPVKQAKVVAPDLSSAAWAPLSGWLENKALPVYALYLFEHPYYTLSVPFDTPPLTYNNASGQLQFYEPPHRAIQVFETIFAPNKYVVILEAILALALAGVRRLLGRREILFLIGFVVVGLISMLLAWHGDGTEVTRHMLEGDVQARLGVSLVATLALLEPSQSRLGGPDHQGIETNESSLKDDVKSETSQLVPSF